jgi:hypothetical protein
VLLDPESRRRGYFKSEMVESVIDRHDDGIDLESKPLWALFMLELWHREFVDRTPSVDALQAVA